MEKNLSIILRPESIQFTKTYLGITDSRLGNYRILYKDIVIASLRIHDKTTENWYEPEITEITKGMDGELLLRDNRNCQWIIYTDQAKRTAEAILSDLAMNAPYILIGRQTWLDIESKDDFSKISSMVDLMRQC